MIATRNPPAPRENLRRRRMRGQVSGISIPGTFRWRFDEATVEAFLSGEFAPPAVLKCGPTLTANGLAGLGIPARHQARRGTR